MPTSRAGLAQGLCLILPIAPAIFGEVRADEPRIQTACPASASLQFVCGAERPEDLAHIPGTRWLIVSGFQNGAGLKLVDTESGTWERWFHALPAQIRADPARVNTCHTPPDVATFNVQGI